MLLAGCGGDSRPARFWTVEQAESIRMVRGTPLSTAACAGVGESRDDRFGRFRCVGKVVVETLPLLPVRVRYVLNPRGRYDGARSPYLATDVRFDSFGVP